MLGLAELLDDDAEARSRSRLALESYILNTVRHYRAQPGHHL